MNGRGVTGTFQQRKWRRHGVLTAPLCALLAAGCSGGLFGGPSGPAANAAAAPSSSLGQFAGFLSGAFEVWFALRLFGHPVDITAALMLESMTQAVRHLAFIVPAGLGVQEAGLIVFGQMIGDA